MTRETLENPEKILRIGDALTAKDPVVALQDFILLKLALLPPDSHLECLTPEAQTLFLVHQFGQAMLAGGMFAFLAGQAGRYTDQTLEALEDLGARDTHRLLQKILDRCHKANANHGLSREIEARGRFLKGLGESFDDECLHADIDFANQINTHPQQSEFLENLWYLSIDYMEDAAAKPVFR